MGKILHHRAPKSRRGVASGFWEACRATTGEVPVRGNLVADAHRHAPPSCPDLFRASTGGGHGKAWGHRAAFARRMVRTTRRHESGGRTWMPGTSPGMTRRGAGTAVSRPAGLGSYPGRFYRGPERVSVTMFAERSVAAREGRVNPVTAWLIGRRGRSRPVLSRPRLRRALAVEGGGDLREAAVGVAADGAAVAGEAEGAADAVGRQARPPCPRR